MATKKLVRAGKSTDRSLEKMDSIARTVAQQLPGWRVAKKPLKVEDATRPKVIGVSRGANIKELRRKFLPTEEAADSAAPDEAFAKPDKKVKSVLVEPIGGGEAKVADVAGGKVKLVQG